MVKKEFFMLLSLVRLTLYPLRFALFSPCDLHHLKGGAYE